MALSCDHIATGDNNLLVNGGFNGCMPNGNTCPDGSWVYDQGTSSSSISQSSTYYASSFNANCRSNKTCAQYNSFSAYAGVKQTVRNLSVGSLYILKLWVTSYNNVPPYGLRIMIDGVLKFNITAFYTGEVNEAYLAHADMHDVLSVGR